MKLWIALLFSSLFLPGIVHASACCGGGFAVPSLISGDDKGQFSGSWTYSEITADVYSDGMWRKRQHVDATRALKLESAWIWNDRFQTGISLPLLERAKAGQTSSGTGDLVITIGYEALTDWDYNPYHPKGIVFFQIVAPTGRSLFESSDALGLDARGRGFWGLGAGALLTANHRSWDIFVSPEVHRSLPKQIDVGGIPSTLTPGWGTSVASGLGYNIRKFRGGGSVSWSYEDPVSVSGEISTVGVLQRSATGSLSLSYLASNEWACTMTYFDQTWFGDPLNTTLAKGASINIQRRWAR